MLTGQGQNNADRFGQNKSQIHAGPQVSAQSTACQIAGVCALFVNFASQLFAPDPQPDIHSLFSQHVGQSRAPTPTAQHSNLHTHLPVGSLLRTKAVSKKGRVL